MLPDVRCEGRWQIRMLPRNEVPCLFLAKSACYQSKNPTIPSFSSTEKMEHTMLPRIGVACSIPMLDPIHAGKVWSCPRAAKA